MVVGGLVARASGQLIGPQRIDVLAGGTPRKTVVPRGEADRTFEVAFEVFGCYEPVLFDEAANDGQVAPLIGAWER